MVEGGSILEAGCHTKYILQLQEAFENFFFLKDILRYSRVIEMLVIFLIFTVYNQEQLLL